jgi:two-component system response regulator LytT
MPLSVLIVDDELLAREELRYLLEGVGDVNIVAEGSNGIEAVNLIEELHPDVVFLDVQMPGLDGFAAIQRLVDHTRPKLPGAAPGVLPQIIFATAYDQYAVRAFDVNAVDYLLKPFDRSRVEEAVERARNRVAAPPTPAQTTESQLDELLRLLNRQGAEARAPQPTKIVVQTGNRMLLVDQAEICFAAIDDGVIRIVTRAVEGHSRCRTLEELQEQLDPKLFWRAHRGYVVNIDHIREVVPWFKSSYQLRMDDKQQTEVPVSRAQTKRLRELFNL